MPKLNVQQNNQNVIQAFRNALAIGNLKGIIASDGSHNFSTAGSNRNLLDNPWFRINQRSVSGTITSGYIADRWTLTYGSGGVTASRTDDTITIASTSGASHGDIAQRMESSLYNYLIGKTITVSLMLNDYSIISRTITQSNTGSSQTLGVDLDGENIYFRFYQSSTYQDFQIWKWRQAGTFRAVKLELGSVSTLANDAPPKESQVTDDCKWYFQRIQQEDGYTSPVGFGMVAVSTNILRALIPLSSPLRKAGTLTATATNIGQMRVQGNGSNLTPTAITGCGVLNGNAVVDITVNGTLTSNQVYNFVFANSTAIIDLSKDL